MKKEILLFFIVFCGFVFWQFYISRFQYGESSLIGHAAPQFEVQSIRDGTTVRSQDLIGKKAIFINFWATWCDTCRLEIANLNEIYQAIDSDQIAFVSILEDAVGETSEAKNLLENYHKKLPVEFPVYLDNQQVVADSYGTFKIPESYVIDRQGKVVYRHDGAILQNEVLKILKILSTSTQ